MKIFKSILNLLSAIFLCGLTITKDVRYAVALLISSGVGLIVAINDLIKLKKIR